MDRFYIKLEIISPMRCPWVLYLIRPNILSLNCNLLKDSVCRLFKKTSEAKRMLVLVSVKT